MARPDISLSKLAASAEGQGLYFHMPSDNPRLSALITDEFTDKAVIKRLEQTSILTLGELEGRRAGRIHEMLGKACFLAVVSKLETIEGVKLAPRCG